MPKIADNRGQSSVVGVLLIMGITVMGVTGVLLYGTGALHDARTQSEINAAEPLWDHYQSRDLLTPQR